MINTYSPQFKKITTLVCLATGVKWKEVTGIKDTSAKLLACYLAKTLTEAHNKQISAFFNINPSYMQIKMEEVAAQLLVDERAEELVELIKESYRHFTSNIKRSA